MVEQAMTGVERIRAERSRQLTEERFDALHDERWDNGELAAAAACYAVKGVRLPGMGSQEIAVWRGGEDAWPWTPGWDKREKHGRLRRLEIAGALIAAEIDRLVRSKTRQEEQDDD